MTRRRQAGPAAWCALRPARVVGWCLAALLAGGLAAFASGCATPAYARPTTRLTVDDFDAMAAHFAQSLTRSAALADRGPQSEPWTIAIQRVLNLSSDVIPEREQWAIMARLQSAQPIRTLGDEKNVTFVLPAERVEQLRRSDDLREIGARFGAQREPTHVMTGVFRSVTRADLRERTELYYLEFELIDLRTGLQAWTDRFEFKRAARGALWD